MRVLARHERCERPTVRLLARAGVRLLARVGVRVLARHERPTVLPRLPLAFVPSFASLCSLVCYLVCSFSKQGEYFDNKNHR